MTLLTCDVCGKNLPIAFFPNPDFGNVCDSCLNSKKEDKTREAIKKKTELVARQAASLTQADIGDTVPRLKTMLSSVYREFGGPDGFSQHFFWIISELSRRKPVPASVGSLMLGFMKLHHSLEQTEETIVAREMSDDQLRRETELATVRMIVEAAANPEKKKMLESILGRHGLKLEEASEQDLIEVAANAVDVDVEQKDFDQEISELEKILGEKPDDADDERAS